MIHEGRTIDIDFYRTAGKLHCNTEGSEHYVDLREDGGIDAIEMAIVNNKFEDFAIVNIIKYALRFGKTRNLKDLKKISDYAHILCGVELVQRGNVE